MAKSATMLAPPAPHAVQQRKPGNRSEARTAGQLRNGARGARGATEQEQDRLDTMAHDAAAPSPEVAPAEVCL
jgi:hypothetical protein